MSTARQEYLQAMSLDELTREIINPQPGSPDHEFIKALLQVRIAELQQGAAQKALQWARLSSVSTAAATAIAVSALVISLFR
jgi:hypothetical protein